jgi:hypothetical protein
LFSDEAADEDAADNAHEAGGPSLPPRQAPVRNVNMALGQGRYSMPLFPAQFPKNMVQFFLIQWERHELSKFSDDPMVSPGWHEVVVGKRWQSAWKKRKYMYFSLRSTADELMVPLKDAAVFMDKDRGRETLSNWMTRVHIDDPLLSHRNRVGVFPTQLAAPPTPRAPVTHAARVRSAATDRVQATGAIRAPPTRAPTPRTGTNSRGGRGGGRWYGATASQYRPHT